MSVRFFCFCFIVLRKGRGTPPHTYVPQNPQGPQCCVRGVYLNMDTTVKAVHDYYMYKAGLAGQWPVFRAFSRPLGLAE